MRLPDRLVRDRSYHVLAVLLTVALVATATVTAAKAQQRPCADTRYPKHLPPLSVLLDSASAVADLAGLSEPRGELLVSLFFNEGDSLPVILPLGGDDRRPLQVLNRLLRPQKPSDIWAVRVHVAGGATPVLTVARSTYCPPSPESRGTDNLPMIASVQIQPGDRMPANGRARMSVEVTVTKDGVVSRVRLVEASGIRDVDDQFVHDFETRRFQPALLDGVPIAGVFRSDGFSPRR
jgi:hypothetical protein